MLSANEEMLAGNVRYFAAYPAVVADDEDPEGLHRVRVTIPGLVDPSAWAWPITAGGGSAQRGGHVVPAKGADVIVWFLGGDVERPVYAGGWWGKPDAGDESPADVTAVTDLKERRLVQSMQIGRVKITFDERPGKEQFFVEDTVSGDVIQLDLVTMGIRIEATAALILKSAGLVQIEGAQVTINDRPVHADSRGI